MLEAAQYSSNCFATLTYSDENLKPSLTRSLTRAEFESAVARNPSLSTSIVRTSDGLMNLSSLQPRELQGFLKRLRKAIEPQRMRFYAVGEYGNDSERPHYHVALFNFGTCVRGRTRRRAGSGRPVWRGCCVQCELVGDAWSFGDVDLGILEVSSAQYVAGYVTKKMTAPDDRRLYGRHPEFARMSNRPGIGLSAMWELADAWMKFDLEESQADVPVSLRHGSRELPLGRYLRRKLRTMVGRDEKTPQAVLDAMADEMQPLRQAAFDASRSFKKEVLKSSKQSRQNFHSRSRIFSKGRGSL